MHESILSTLREEHRQIQMLLLKTERAQSLNKKKELHQELKDNLLIHMDGERRVLYSKLKTEVIDHDVANVVEDAEHESEEIKDLLQMLDEAEFGSEEWRELFEELKEQLQLHVEDVENRVFSEAKESFSREELENMEDEFIQSKGQSTFSAGLI